MMKQKASVKQSRQRYSDEFKEQALRRAEQEGVAMVAKDLKLPASQLYAWRNKAQQRGQASEEQRLQYAENAKLKREVARLEEEVAFLKKAAAYLTQEEAGRHMGIPQPKVSGMMRGDFANLSECKLMECLNRLGSASLVTLIGLAWF